MQEMLGHLNTHNTMTLPQHTKKETRNTKQGACICVLCNPVSSFAMRKLARCEQARVAEVMECHGEVPVLQRYVQGSLCHHANF